MGRAVSKLSLPNSNILPFAPPLNWQIETSDNLKFMRQLSDESMHLIVTSPPYNLGKSYEKRRSQDVYLEEQTATIAEAVRLLHPLGSICWQVGNAVDEYTVIANERIEDLMAGTLRTRPMNKPVYEPTPREIE